MIALVALALFIIAGVEALLLLRASRRLLQFDDLFQQTVGVLDVYSSDLVRMSSADLDGILVDHPEVEAFHRRNMSARREIQGILEALVAVSPRRPKRPVPELPRPDVE